MQWQTFCAVYRSLNRKGELERLARWATHKNLPGPRRAYQHRVDDEERRIMRYAFHSPRLVRWARLLQWLSLLVRKTPRYPAKGSAAHYRRGNGVEYRKTYSRHGSLRGAALQS
jgi:hypothetical protein